ncbi:hypothetical protein AZI86_13375 [Bdellovibrio bacteriovorus]|uniref:Esterase n=2 Tax=Bdellovibrio bacteriovorus TaxID=959 RepID=A0A150WJ65_BDEBC|nr:hypothetical protein AZI86_13375 [Bdellovibrio bacteriovorus]
MVFLSFKSWAGAPVETCGEITSPISYKYCYTTYNRTPTSAVLYYLHGGGGDEHEWTQISQSLNKSWGQDAAGAPVVVNISFGPYWLLVPENSSAQSGLVEIFGNTIIPQMEKLVLGRAAQKRWLMGLSMGGFNGAQVIGNLPAGTFQRALLACPAIVDLSPWASDNELLDYVKKHGADLRTLKAIAQIAQPFVPDSATWHEVISPFTLLTPIRQNVSSLFIATNQQDRTFQYGGNLFAKKIREQKSDVKFESWSGGHCHLNGEAIKKYFSN